MQTDVLGLVADVVKAASRERPADRVLRETFQAARGLEKGMAGKISRAVFAYYRWFAWLETQKGLAKQLQYALDLADRFAREPASFSDADLLRRVLPAWAGDELEITPALARALQAEPQIWIRAQPGQGAPLAKHLGTCRPAGQGGLADSFEYFGHKDLFRTEEFHAGIFELQDLSSQCVGLICNPQPEQTWWDACAGEGGKLLHLSALMQNKGLIWASDRAAWRLQKLKRRAARARVFNYRSAVWDGGAKLPMRTRFDGILLDAPCTGMGTWHRNPQARWTTQAGEVKELARLQSQLLLNASQALKPGAKLVYSVCTLTRSETIEVVKAFESPTRDLQALQISNPLLEGAAATPHLLLKLEQTGGNGMFIAAWKRTS